MDEHVLTENVLIAHAMMTSSMETFFALLALCAGNSPVTGEFLSQRPVTRSFGVFSESRLSGVMIYMQCKQTVE